MFVLMSDTTYLCRFYKENDIFVKNSNNPYALNVFKFHPPNKEKICLFVASLVEFNAYILSVYFFKL